MTETTNPQPSLRAVFTVTVESRKGAAYFDRDGFVLHAVSRIEGALESSDDIRDVIVVEAEPAAPVPPPAPTDRAAELAAPIDQDTAKRVAQHLDNWEMQSSLTRADYPTLACEVIAIVQSNHTPADRPAILREADFQDRGEAARQAAGIDGTAGDAQDVPHAFVLDEPTGGCLLCGLSPTYRMHAAVSQPGKEA